MTNLLTNAIVRQQVAKKAGQSAAQWRCERGRGGAQPNSRAVNLRSMEGGGGRGVSALLPHCSVNKTGELGWKGAAHSTTRRGRDDFVEKAARVWHLTPGQLYFYLCAIIVLCSLQCFYRCPTAQPAMQRSGNLRPQRGKTTAGKSREKGNC